MFFKQFLNGIMLSSIYDQPVMGSILDFCTLELISGSARSGICQVRGQPAVIGSSRPGRRGLKSMTQFPLKEAAITAMCTVGNCAALMELFYRPL